MRAGLLAPVVALRRTAHDRPLRRLQLAWAAVMVASWTATVSLSVVAYGAGGSPAVAAAVLARTVPGLFLGPALGSLVDRWPRSRVLAGAALVSAVACGAAAVAGRSFVAVVGLVAVVAMATMVFRAAQSAVLPELVGAPSDLTAANVLSSAVEALGVFAGPALAGALLAARGPDLAFGVAGSLYAAAGVLALRSRPRRTHRPRAHGPAPGGSLAQVLRLPAVRLVLGLVLVQTLVGGGLTVLLPAVAVDVLDTRLSAVGSLTAASGLGGVVGSIALFSLAGSRRLGRLTGCALLLWSIPLLVLPVVPELTTVLVLLAVVGVGNVLFDVCAVTLLQRAVPPHLLGRTFGALETVVVAGSGAGAVAAPLLERALGAGPAVAVLATPLAAVAVGALPLLRRLDTSVTAPVRQVDLLRAVAPFALLPPVELEALALRLRRRVVDAGERVVGQGDVGTSWFAVDQGTLAVAVDGRDVTELADGEGFGEVALLHGGVRSATVTARSAAVLWELDGADYLAALGAEGAPRAAALGIARARLDRAAPGRS